MDVSISPSELNGDVPDLEGSACEAFQIQEFWYDGELGDPVNVAYVQLRGNWHRLYFDHGYVFWRKSDSGPRGFIAPEVKGNYRIVDVGSTCGVEGVVLSQIRISSEQDGNIVDFEFENGTRIRICGLFDDQTRWENISGKS